MRLVMRGDMTSQVALALNAGLSQGATSASADWVDFELSENELNNSRNGPWTPSPDTWKQFSDVPQVVHVKWIMFFPKYSIRNEQCSSWNVQPRVDHAAREMSRSLGGSRSKPEPDSNRLGSPSSAKSRSL